MKSFLFLIFGLLFLPIVFAAKVITCQKPYVAVTGFAQSFLSDARISHAKISILETGKIIQTNNNGRFQFCAKPGSTITLTLAKSSLLPWKNFKTTQSATFTVPQTGFVGPYHEITFQVPTMTTYRMFKFIIAEERGITIDPKKCVAVTTVAGYHKTLKNNPQGEAGAVIQLQLQNQDYYSKNKPFYFGIIGRQTDPFTPNLTKTSLDGGVLIYNLATNAQPYKITALKAGTQFSSAKFECRPGAFINISPPQGPTAKGGLIALPHSRVNASNYSKNQPVRINSGFF